ncbi:MAG: AtpZ/AtpI family protein [Candidatus Pacebacteria bacterium]|nr:AtpZ/AtpI family protein [Candidatus Paceibacterota bacterium]
MMSPKNTPTTEKDTGMRTALLLFAKVSGWIAFPIVGSLLIGKWLDRIFNTAPYFFLGLTAIAFFISMYGLIKESRHAMKQIEDEIKKSTIH